VPQNLPNTENAELASAGGHTWIRPLRQIPRAPTTGTILLSDYATSPVNLAICIPGRGCGWSAGSFLGSGKGAELFGQFG